MKNLYEYDRLIDECDCLKAENDKLRAELVEEKNLANQYQRQVEIVVKLSDGYCSTMAKQANQIDRLMKDNERLIAISAALAKELND